MLLVFDGVDTVSSISLNGMSVGKTDNMFRRYVRRSKRRLCALSSVYLHLFEYHRLCLWSAGVPGQRLAEER